MFNCFGMGTWLKFIFNQQGVQMDDNFFRTDSPSSSNGWIFFWTDSRSHSNENQICSKTANHKEHFLCERWSQGTVKMCSPCSLILIFSVFSLLLSYASQQPSGNTSLWCTPLPTGKFGKLIPPPPWKFRSLPWGWYGYFLESQSSGSYTRQGLSISIYKRNCAKEKYM